MNTLIISTFSCTFEDFEGQNYNAYKSRDPDYETIYKKRLKQIREDFPIPDQFKERTS